MVSEGLGRKAEREREGQRLNGRKRNREEEYQRHKRRWSQGDRDQEAAKERQDKSEVEGKRAEIEDEVESDSGDPETKDGRQKPTAVETIREEAKRNRLGHRETEMRTSREGTRLRDKGRGGGVKGPERNSERQGQLGGLRSEQGLSRV